MPDNMIEVRNVTMKFRMGNQPINSLKEYVTTTLKGTLKFNEFVALNDLSFDVKRGETLGFVGRNGAGKSTTLKCISGILKPTSGTIRTYGNIVPMLELGAGFDLELTGRENIYLNGAVLGYSKAYLDEKYNEIVEFSELGDFIEMPIRSYSSGMMARLAFSIASIVQPEILIVDEILSVGDAAFKEKSSQRMKELMTGGTTVLFVSHDIDKIEELCDKVIWLEHGKKIAYGDAKEICDLYRNKEVRK
ncbi:MAG: ABC transporter ATP-binding protein [Erysipelotrichaceae bacterium]|nr:ABC transporter ATP-binding protein [Erysipelotrichaceae bacterium]